MNKFFIFLILAIVAGSPKVVTFTHSDVKRASEKFPGSTKQTLIAGKDIFTNSCGNCHPYKEPSTKTEAQWKIIVPKMVVAVNKKQNIEVINSKKEVLLLAYLVTMSTAPKK